MAKKTWGRPLQPTKLPVIGGATGFAILTGAAILYWRRRHARGIEIKMAENTVGSVIHELNSAEAGHLLILMSTDYRLSLENIFSGTFEMDPEELKRGQAKYELEKARLDARKATTPRWHLQHRLSQWLHHR